MQIPNPKCNQQQTNHYITEITPYKSKPKSNSTLKSGVGEGSEVVRRRSSGSRAIRLVIR
jgi:hypothetical protein